MMRARLFISLFVTACLAGCDASSQFVDLQAYMDEVRARPKGSIEPLPKFQPYEAFTYNAGGMRSPFQKPVKIDVASQQKGSKDIKPDESRVKQFFWRASRSKFSKGRVPFRIMLVSLVWFRELEASTESKWVTTLGVTMGASYR